MFKPTKNHILLGVAVLAVLLTGILVFANSTLSQSNVLSFLKFSGPYSSEAIAKKSIDYLNSSVLQGQTAELVEASEESGVVKMKIKIGDNAYDSYATKDGKLLFPEAFALGASSGSLNPSGQNSAKGTIDTVEKVAKTQLDAYVVANCPYGLQIQRAIADAVKSVPSLAEFIKIRYIGEVSGNTITAMHGTEEAEENFRQIGIRQEQPSKYWAYVSCYMQKTTGKAANGMPYGDSKNCQKVAGVDSAKLNACIADPNRCLAYAKEDFALQAKYNVSGSPTLILNGTTIDETSFGGRTPDSMRNIVCSSSETAPDFCGTKLNTTPATTSFSLTYAGSNATASANNNCAPAVQ